MWAPLLTLVGAGIVVAVALVFWADLQNWMAGVIDRARVLLGPATHTLQSALVTMDRVMVGSQRVILVTGRVFLRETQTDQAAVTEEVREIDPQALPADVRSRLEAGQSVSYEISSGNAT
jgi:hypothetical protein